MNSLTYLFIYFTVNYTLVILFTTEFKINVLASELLIDTRKHFNLVFRVVLLRFVQMNLYEPAAIQVHAEPLAHNFTGEDQVLNDGIVHSCQGEAPGNVFAYFS
jgi:hypothetical protein